MARTTRKVLDLALVSVEKLQPVLSKSWGRTKCYVMDTKARIIVDNRLVEKLEDVFSSIPCRLRNLRDRQLPKEAEYLRRELKATEQRIQKISESGSKCRAAKTTKRYGGIAWRYIKVEAVPPLTIDIFNGPAGAKLEEIAGRAIDGVTKMLATSIRQIDAAEERRKRLIAEAIKAEQEKLIKQKLEEEKKKLEAAKLAAAKAAEAAKKAALEAAAKEAKKKLEEDAKKPKPKLDKKKKPKKKAKPTKKAARGGQTAKAARGGQTAKVVKRVQTVKKASCRQQTARAIKPTKTVSRRSAKAKKSRRATRKTLRKPKDKKK